MSIGRYDGIGSELDTTNWNNWIRRRMHKQIVFELIVEVDNVFTNSQLYRT